MDTIQIILLMLQLTILGNSASPISKRNDVPRCQGKIPGDYYCPENSDKVHMGNFLGFIPINSCFTKCGSDYDRFLVNFCRKKHSFTKFKTSHKIKGGFGC